MLDCSVTWLSSPGGAPSRASNTGPNERRSGSAGAPVEIDDKDRAPERRCVAQHANAGAGAEVLVDQAPPALFIRSRHQPGDP